MVSLGVSAPAFIFGCVIYVLIASVVTPTYDPHDIGWGNGLLNNPFSWTDDYNRSMLWLAVLLYPGKLVVWTLRATWAWLGRPG